MSLRIGIIGASGHWGYVPRDLGMLPGARICAVAPGCAEEDIAGLVAQTRDAAPTVYPDYRELLDREAPDIVAVNPPYYLHAEICQAALARGIAPFCEKPLALTMASLAAVHEAQQAVGRPVGIMLPYRYEPVFYTARQLVQAGVIGEPIIGYAQKSYTLGVRPDFYKRRATFGGIIPWVGIHAIDWFQWVSGRRYTTVTARHQNLSAPAFPELEDHATCLFTLDNGGSAVMSFDYLRPRGLAHSADDRLRLVGAAGFIEIRFPEMFLVARDGEGEVTVPLEAPPLPLFADFAHAVLDPAHTPLLTTADAFAITAVALQARDAADTGKTVTIRG